MTLESLSETFFSPMTMTLQSQTELLFLLLDVSLILLFITCCLFSEQKLNRTTKMASLDLDEDIHRLEGSSGDESGGLIIMKKGPSKGEAASHTFKKPDVPRVSLLGLDKLSAAKRELQSEVVDWSPKRSKVLSYRDDEEDDVEDNNDKHSRKKHRDKER